MALLVRKKDYDKDRERYLFAFLELDFEKLVNGFFVVEGVHDGEIDGTTEVDEVGARLVLDTFLVGHGWESASVLYKP
jgi:hypothetical protein